MSDWDDIAVEAEVDRRLLFTPLPNCEPPETLRAQLDNHVIDANEFHDRYFDWVESTIVELGMRENDRGEALADELISRHRQFSAAVGCPRIAASLTHAWATAMAQRR